MFLYIQKSFVINILKFGFKSVGVTRFFFLQIYNKVRTGEKVKVEHVVSVLEKKYPYVEVNSILGIDSAYDQNRKVRTALALLIGPHCYIFLISFLGGIVIKKGSKSI